MNDDDLMDEPDALTRSLRALMGDELDLGDRTAERVDRRLRASSVSGLCAELLGVGWWTLTEMLTSPAPAADGNGRGDDDG